MKCSCGKEMVDYCGAFVCTDCNEDVINQATK